MNANIAANGSVFQVQPLTAPCTSYQRTGDEQTPRAAFSLDPKFAHAIQRIAVALYSLTAENAPGVARGTVALRIGATRLVGCIAIVLDKTDINAPIRPRAHFETLSVRS